MAPQFQVRRARAEDLPKILEFHKSCQPDRPKLHDGDRWTWRFLDHPDERESPSYFVIDSNDQIEGTLGYVPLEFRVRGRPVGGTFPVDYFVNPAFRGLPALLLMKTVMALRPITIESNFSDDAERLLDRLGFIDLEGFVKDYYLPLANVVPAGDRRGSLSVRSLQLLKRAYRYGAPGILSAVDSVLGYRGNTRTFRVLDRDSMPRLPAADESIRIEKSYSYLRWRYRDAIGLQPVFVSYSLSGKPAALAILNESANGRAIQVLDVVGGYRYGPLIRAIIAYGRQFGAASISATCADTRLGRALRMHGFGASRSGVGLRAHTSDQTLREYLAVGREWKFYLGDSDVL